jgi:hypothetical protein
MSLAEAQAWKHVSQCPSCWDGTPPPKHVFGAVEVRYEIGFGFASSTAKGWLSIPGEQWRAIMPEDRDDFVLDMIKKQAAEQLQISYRVDE